MKLFICVCFLVVVIGPCVEAKSFNFGNFFLGSGKKAVDSNSDIPTSSFQRNVFDSEPLDYSTEVDTEGFNSSSDDIFDFDYQNSSSDSLEISNRSEPDDIPVVSNNTEPPVVDAEVLNNETHSSAEEETTTPAPTTTTTETSDETTTLAEVPPTANTTKESPSSVSTEQEEVVLGTTTGATDVLISKSFYQKSIDWMADAYTLSILIPITAGILFATTIIIIIALCRCVRRCCRRRSFKRKPLPDSVKNLRPSDRARLLGDTSDEEF